MGFPRGGLMRKGRYDAGLQCRTTVRVAFGMDAVLTWLAEGAYACWDAHTAVRQSIPLRAAHPLSLPA